MDLHKKIRGLGIDGYIAIFSRVNVSPEYPQWQTNQVHKKTQIPQWQTNQRGQVSLA